MARGVGATPLLIASEQGHGDVVRQLLEGGAAINQSKEDGATPLYAASEDGHRDVVDILLKHGAVPDQPMVRVNRRVVTRTTARITHSPSPCTFTVPSLTHSGLSSFHA